MEIKIIWANNQLFGVQKSASGRFHDLYERYPYIGAYGEGRIVEAKLIYQAMYPGNQWADIPDDFALTSDRKIRRVYVDND